MIQHPFSKRRLLGLLGMTVMVAVTAQLSVAEENSRILIRQVVGPAEFSAEPGEWQPLRTHSRIPSGAVLRTGDGATVDFSLQASATTLRLTPNSTLSIERLQVAHAGEQFITDTQLRILEGSIVGSQRKMAKLSRFQVITRNGTAHIVGTEYVIRADGAVSVLSGTVSLHYNLPGNRGSVKVSIPAGQSFDPATGSVVPTTPDFLEDIIADVDTVRYNAQTFKAGGATLVVKPDRMISPTKPGGNNGVGNGVDPQPPGNPPINDGPGTSPGNPGNRGGAKK